MTLLTNPPKKMPDSIWRTVKNGQVVIYGKVYRPQAYYMERDNKLDGKPYRDELEELRLCFSLYYVRDRCGSVSVDECQSVNTSDILHPSEVDWYWEWWVTEQNWQDTVNDIPHWRQWERDGILF